MKLFFMHSQAQAHTAAIRNILETDQDREARTAIVCRVKVVNKRRAHMRMVAEVVKVGDQEGDLVEVVVEFHTTELDSNLHHSQ